ncbi:TetR/AcrR family transcriptional regulator [Chitinimonas sp. PSY-7]|uniref:TetR family transcriptional regulator n=1 Tax=Chitinimonas sp. PSY-7 TaxID=3459088 RepID=UPI0040402CA0
MKHFAELSPAAERIVDAAEALVQQVGFNGFSYEDIAQKVGIKKPSVHHHFPTKVELVVVMTQRYTHRFREQLLRIEGIHPRGPDRLQAYAELFASTFANHRRLCVCGMLGAETDSLPEEIRAEVQRFFRINVEWLRDVILHGQEQQKLHKEPAAYDMAQLFLSALEGSMLVGRGLTDTQGPAAVTQTLFQAWQT